MEGHVDGPFATLCWPPFLSAGGHGPERLLVNILFRYRTSWPARRDASAPDRTCPSGRPVGAQRAAPAMAAARTILVMRGSEAIASQDVSYLLPGKVYGIRLDVPPCPEPAALQLMLLDTLLTAPVYNAPAHSADSPSPPRAAERHSIIHHLAGLPVLPTWVAAEARALLLRQVSAAPLGAEDALRYLADRDGAPCRESGGGESCRDVTSELPPPGLWLTAPTRARAAIEWAWCSHFSPFARDVCFALAGPGPDEARAALLESLLSFTTACGMTGTALHLLHSCAKEGFVSLVSLPDVGPSSAVVKAASLCGVGFVTSAGASAALQGHLEPQPAGIAVDHEDGAEDGGTGMFRLRPRLVLPPAARAFVNPLGAVFAPLSSAMMVVLVLIMMFISAPIFGHITVALLM